MMSLYPDGQKLENMLFGQHSSFNVYIGKRIEPDDNLKVTRKIELRDYRCPILKFSYILVFSGLLLTIILLYG